MIINTAKLHFDEDIGRARSLHLHAVQVQEDLLKNDILRSAWMLAVGASDAFFCDAYADLITRTLRAKDLQPSGNLEGKLKNLKVPVSVFLSTRGGWRWRMAAREMMERESVLSIQQIKDLLNSFCRINNKILTSETIVGWATHDQARHRMFGCTRHQFNNLEGQNLNTQKKKSLDKLQKRMQSIFQRRHDCIHNCDRPRNALKRISADSTLKAIDDIDFVVNRCVEHLRREFPLFLADCDFSAQTRNAVGA
jgi:hypothetical protein